ncbi:MAG: DUF1256 domain-containing protein [Christensenellales bacterium]
MQNLLKYDISDKFLTSSLSADLLKRFGKDVPTIVCLGSDKVLSDMVGILVADKLKKLKVNTLVFGGSDFVVTSKNIDCLLNKINSNNILFIDSAITQTKNHVFFNNKGIKLKNNKFYKGASICAGTIFYKDNKIQLANIGLKQVNSFAKNIILSITDYLSYLQI